MPLNSSAFIFVAACITLLSVFSSCAKSDEIHTSATIFSKHHIPMPLLTFTIDIIQGGKDETVGTMTLATDADGFFKFDQQAHRYISYTNIKHLDRMHVITADSGSLEQPFPNGQNLSIQLK